MAVGSNFTSPAGGASVGNYSDADTHNLNNSTTASNILSPSNSTSSSSENTLCIVCPNSVGICCPHTVSCDEDDGKCPESALELSGNTLNGYLIAQVMNSTAPVAGRRKVRALTRKKHTHGSKHVGSGSGGGLDLRRDEVVVERRRAQMREF